ncbi:T9SS type A sorting domain-containing protein [candidate division KSB1 bacterium]|nr:T9SS type A sorting domain-containing protein [candidate division KSB1 bacterium]NIR68784.1 T9SS type A sorting domain-containing protein [candidate division KSB1 bacterium]NIS28116.1 T9SS type A sorting domain-containing protein [candidate division KSB1 bacterium]NIT75012.1 T9SS type A sorting domain-containing protein [candidate division KSB1 bacterium]NIU28796.1 T9SS type A sorting domain-containing protein [candidate division KSB1 bacterium]
MMFKVQLKALTVSISLLLCYYLSAHAQTLPEGFSVIGINESLDGDATGFALLPDEQRILVINYQKGEVKLITNGILKSQPLLTVPDLLFSSEQGLLGIAIDPDFPNSNYVYLFHTRKDSTNNVSRFTVEGDLADPNSDNLSIDVGSQQILIQMPDTLKFHNGGTLRFGNDKTLYISHGDDVHTDFIQNLTTLYGKILRINRDGSIPEDNPTFPSEPEGKRGEIFAFGLRNPFRFSIDPETQQLFIGDVGTTLFEELNLSSGGENFGYPRYEGFEVFRPEAELIPPDPVFPIFAYPQERGSSAVIALAAYRQKDFPNDSSFPEEYDGTFFFADFFSGPIYNLRPDGEGGWTRIEFASGFTRPVDAALGSDGSLYILEFGRALKKIVFDPVTHVEDIPSAQRPEAFFLSQNHPNPFNLSTTIRFSLDARDLGPAETRRATLTVYNISGNEVVTLLDEPLAPGIYARTWGGKNQQGKVVSTGLYIYNLRYGDLSQTKKMILQK